MAIERIDSIKCTGCRICIESCAQDVIRMEDEKAIIKYPEDCMSCFNCEMECPTEAIYVTPERNFPPFLAWR